MAKTTRPDEKEILTELIVESESPEAADGTKTMETVERISKSIAIGRKEVRHEDGRNFISVIINAISVNINMPRGTVKALVACFLALLLCAGIYGLSRTSSKPDAEPTSDAAISENETANSELSGTNNNNNEEQPAANTNDLAISDNYGYHLPDNTYNVEGPYNDYIANECWVDFEYDKTHYAIRSYAIMEAGSGDLEEEVHGMMEEDGYMDIVKEGRVDTDFGNVLRVEFETEDADGIALKVTGFYWYDSDPTICCFEVTNDTEVDAKVEDMLLKLVYKMPGSDKQSAPDSYVYEPDVDEAMKGEVEDAWREYNDPPPDISDRIVKP